MKKVMLVLATLIVAGMAQAGSITWGTTGGQWIYDQTGSLMTNGAGVVQLVYVGADGAQAVSGTGQGTSGNDVVVQSGSVGTGASAPKGGKYTGGYAYTYGTTVVSGQTVDNGDQFVIRIYNSTTVASSTWYWQSTVYTISVATAGNPNGIDNFYITSKTTGWTPIPEPATMALALVGVGAIALRRRFMKK